jgi:hypothetical protein
MLSPCVERRPDATLSWRGVVRGLEDARVWVRLLANETDHACFAMYTPRKKIVVRVSPRVVQDRAE